MIRVPSFEKSRREAGEQAEDLMTNYRPMEKLPDAAGYKQGDVLVLVGELFGRGYANGLVEEARRIGMDVIGTTVGRRDSDGSLRPLSADELAEAEALLGGSVINVPLEAGFDMEQVDGQPSVAEQLKKAKPDEWASIRFSPDFVEKARDAGTARFRAALAQVMQQLAPRIPAGANVLFAHSMAGGIPRARVFMPLLNRVIQGNRRQVPCLGGVLEQRSGPLVRRQFQRGNGRYLPLPDRRVGRSARASHRSRRAGSLRRLRLPRNRRSGGRRVPLAVLHPLRAGVGQDAP